MNSRRRQWSPSSQEILCTVSRRLIYARIYLMDGTFPISNHLYSALSLYSLIFSNQLYSALSLHNIFSLDRYYITFSGAFHAVEFEPTATANDVIEIIKNRIGLRGTSQGFALYEVLGDVERSMVSDEKLTDVMGKWERYR